MSFGVNETSAIDLLREELLRLLALVRGGTLDPTWAKVPFSVLLADFGVNQAGLSTKHLDDLEDLALLLLAHPPLEIDMVIGRASQTGNDPNTTASALAGFLQRADGIGLSLQGPPGTGKTTVTGELIAQLVAAGQRVAVSSNTNEAINNLLRKVQDRLDARSSSALVVKVASSSSEKADVKALAGSRVQALQEKNLSSIPAVLGGTIFTFVKEAYDETPFDLLVIDEAGQVSLSNLLYMSRIARNIILVGDQQQLSQPNRAAHPEDSGLSCLDYVMAKEPVVPNDRGVFLATSWRMPPALTQVVSNLFYAGKLQAAAANSANRVEWLGQAQGLLFEPVHHSGNCTASEEEVERIAALVDQLYGQPYHRAKLVNGEMTTVRRELGQHDILITAPYNMQVNRLQKRIGHKARIGTVDKFQGQVAPVAIHSLTASDGDSAPRGLDFLLDPNRLNVAISRAQCLSIVVGSPELATGVSNSIGNVQRLNRLCSLMAAELPPDGQEVGAWPVLYTPPTGRSASPTARLVMSRSASSCSRSA